MGSIPNKNKKMLGCWLQNKCSLWSLFGWLELEIKKKNCELFPKFNRLLFKMNIYFKKTIDIKNKIWRAT